jgi:hypothetical protein
VSARRARPRLISFTMSRRSPFLCTSPLCFAPPLPPLRCLLTRTFVFLSTRRAKLVHFWDTLHYSAGRKNERVHSSFLSTKFDLLLYIILGCSGCVAASSFSERRTVADHVDDEACTGWATASLPATFIWSLSTRSDTYLAE